MSSEPVETVDSSNSKELRLPKFFPLVAKKCENISETFFKCLSEKSFDLDKKEQDVGPALNMCCDELQAYVTCMEDHYAKEEEKRNRKKRFFGLF